MEQQSSTLLVAGVLIGLPLFVAVAVVVILSGGEAANCPKTAAMGQGVAGPTGVTLAGLGEQQLQIARNGVAIGKQRQLPDNVILSQSMAAATESGYRNPANPSVPESLQYPHDGIGTDHDSVGPHQLRASVWGKAGMAKLMDPIFQINWFYDGAVKLSGYESMDPAALAQAVERSGVPDAYSRKRNLAQQVVAAFSGARAPAAAGITPDPGCTPAGPGFTPGGPFGQNVIAAAMRWIGVRYTWGGGNQTGPTVGAGDSHGDNKNAGFDCSGLTLNAVYAASGGKILLPHFTGSRSNPGQLYDPRGQNIPFDQKQPGDLIYFGSGGDTHHVGIYYGQQNGQDMLLNAPQSGKTVSIMALSGWKGEEMYVRRFG